ncbi:hypothetical protein HO173_007088 [Letharia columbiana]|uniref:Uncharacterized protein n=1 Tax=Letharia columbiana TaxID=112416 RepID=A0A8H6L458_9LECA|nr:uncharacterized protein HO173_007088 [Letharia columbiana]KAF6234868.1 hypothetical protein HO173_007088 [Letharia columbiana]
MQAFLQTLHEQYRTEYYGPWHTRECYPWEYDVKAQECIQLASKSDPQFFLPQAKILQDRAAYIRQEWARLEALQAIQPVTQPITQPATQQVTQPITQQEEEPLQANAENTAESTAEKASDNKATITKNTAQLSKIPRHMLSTLPRQTTTQQENDTTIWPAISACLGNITLWYITAMTIQEKDLLRRSQPNHYGQLGLCRGTSDDGYLDELKPSDVLLRYYSRGFTAAGELVGFTPLIGLVSPFLSSISKTHSFMHAYFLP